MKNKKDKKDLEKKAEDLNLEEVLEKKRKRRRIITIVLVIITLVIMTLGMTYVHFYGNYKYIRADIKISSSSKLYSNSDPADTEDVGEGALFIILLEGIKRDDFLEQYEVLDITVNGEKIDLEKVIYRHLNNALSIRMHTKNYYVDDGNVVIISVKEKSKGHIITKRLYNTTEVV